ncbi:uncharacterized protein LOC124655059 [Lolium rigidum]|uniref:uncharacterized protein LOC124655059 n=1 Tax=Lolium rigidum TaxID=89674 RepID=UPI001F5CC053|nr:uncharacterized protein LOC124655059 [Lolium rigidum]
MTSWIVRPCIDLDRLRSAMFFSDGSCWSGMGTPPKMMVQTLGILAFAGTRMPYLSGANGQFASAVSKFGVSHNPAARRIVTGLSADTHSRGVLVPAIQRGHHRSFASIYVDELYSQPKGLSVVRKEEPQPNTSKLARDTDRTDDVINKTRVHGHGIGAATATPTGGGSKARAGGRSAGVRGFLLSPGRGGCGMGEVDVDVRAEMFIRKFSEEMWLQSPRSAEEFQAMLARGL